MVAALQRAQQSHEALGAAFLGSSAAGIAGSANRYDPKALRRNRVDLGIAMAGDQHLGSVVRWLDERSEEMLAVPHRQDDRRIVRNAFDGVRWLQNEATGVPDQYKG